MTASEFSKMVGVTHRTVLNWLKNGLIEGAYLRKVRGAGNDFWVIPPEGVMNFVKPPMGRPRNQNGKTPTKKKREKKSKKRK
jgi:hypothetical protein